MPGGGAYPQVTDEMTSIIMAQLLFLESENPEKPISMYINSPGGSVCTVHATKARDKLNPVSVCTSSTVDATKARDKLNPVSLCTSSTVHATKAGDIMNPVSFEVTKF